MKKELFYKISMALVLCSMIWICKPIAIHAAGSINVTTIDEFIAAVSANTYDDICITTDMELKQSVTILNTVKIVVKDDVTFTIGQGGSLSYDWINGKTDYPYLWLESNLNADTEVALLNVKDGGVLNAGTSLRIQQGAKLVIDEGVVGVDAPYYYNYSDEKTGLYNEGSITLENTNSILGVGGTAHSNYVILDTVNKKCFTNTVTGSIAVNHGVFMITSDITENSSMSYGMDEYCLNEGTITTHNEGGILIEGAEENPAPEAVSDLGFYNKGTIELNGSGMPNCGYSELSYLDHTGESTSMNPVMFIKIGNFINQGTVDVKNLTSSAVGIYVHNIIISPPAYSTFVNEGILNIANTAGDGLNIKGYEYDSRLVNDTTGTINITSSKSAAGISGWRHGKIINNGTMNINNASGESKINSIGLIWYDTNLTNTGTITNNGSVGYRPTYYNGTNSFPTVTGTPIAKGPSGKEVIEYNFETDPISKTDCPATFTLGGVPIRCIQSVYWMTYASLSTFIPVGETMTVSAVTDSGISSQSYTCTAQTLAEYQQSQQSGWFKVYLGVRLSDFTVPSTLTLKVGENYQVNPVLTPANAYNPDLSMYSDKESIATVSDTGLITAVAAGKTEISAYCPQLQDSRTITVTVVAASGGTVVNPSPPVAPPAAPVAAPVAPVVAVPVTPSIQNPTEQTTLKVGDTTTINGAVYKVTGKAMVEYLKPTSSKKASVTVPSTIKVNGVTYKVTSVADKAFKNNAKLTKLTIGTNVTNIGSNAFYGCKKLKTITIKTTKLKSIGKNALKGIYSKATITCPKKQLKAYKKLFTSKSGYTKKITIK